MKNVHISTQRALSRRHFLRGTGVLLGLPYYDAMPIPKVVAFYNEVAQTFPDMSIMIYHNPVNHRVHIPMRVFPELVKNFLADYASEHFEIACYRSLITAADECDQSDIADICTEIMGEEEAMAEWIEEQIPEVTRMILAQTTSASS